MMRAAWIAVVVAGCSPARCRQAASSNGAPGDATISNGPPLDRHWGHQTLEQLLGMGAPDTPVLESAQPMIGVEYEDLLAQIGGTVPGLSCSGNWTSGHCTEEPRDVFYIPGFADDRPLYLYVSMEQGLVQSVAVWLDE